MVPDAIVAGNIEVFENAITDGDKIIEDVELACQAGVGVHWSRATTVGSGAYQDLRTNWDLGISHFAKITGNETMVNLHNKINELLVSAATGYKERNRIEEMFWQEGYNLLKYESGQQYKTHYDGSTAQGRFISCVLYLNDNYTGGEIEFPAFGIKIKPPAGTLILFPSNFAYRHIAHPVKTGTKYAMATWLHDRPL